jgi:hypothetical protein
MYDFDGHHNHPKAITALSPAREHLRGQKRVSKKITIETFSSLKENIYFISLLVFKIHKYTAVRK